MTRLHLPLGILWLTIQEHLWFERRSVMTRLAWYLHELWWHIWKSTLSLWENDWFPATSRGSCHPCPYTFMNWPKMLQNGKSVYSLWILIPSISYPFPHNVAMLHTPQLVLMPRSYLDIQITSKPITPLPIHVSQTNHAPSYPCLPLYGPCYIQRKKETVY